MVLEETTRKLFMDPTKAYLVRKICPSQRHQLLKYPTFLSPVFWLRTVLRSSGRVNLESGMPPVFLPLSWPQPLRNQSCSIQWPRSHTVGLPLFHTPWLALASA